MIVFPPAKLRFIEYYPDEFQYTSKYCAALDSPENKNCASPALHDSGLGDTTWLFLWIGGLFTRYPCNESHAIWGLH